MNMRRTFFKIGVAMPLCLPLVLLEGANASEISDLMNGHYKTVLNIGKIKGVEAIHGKLEAACIAGTVGALKATNGSPTLVSSLREDCTNAFQNER
jgi:hypothetical protein